MNGSELQSVLEKFSQEDALGLSDEARAAIGRIAATLSLFADRPIDQFLAKIEKIKPNKSKQSTVGSRAKRTPAAAVELRSELVQAYVRELREMLGDHKLTLEVLAKLKGDKKARKEEVLAIAREIGVKAGTKALALQQIEGISARQERERFIADRIRGGA